ncbi:MAG: DNA polymerase II, partial [Leptospirales bacterium]
LDGPMVMRAAFYNFPDFRLESVARSLLGRGKLIHESEAAQKIAEIDRQFREDRPQLARYNLEDCELVSEIFQYAGLIELWKRRSQISGMLLDQIGRSVAAFDFFLLPRLHRKGYVAISEQDVHFEAAAPGGYVMEPKSGLYEDVIVLDFRSLYPSIIRTFRIDPYSRLMQQVAGDENPIEVPGGQFRFSRTEHILPDFIGELLELRARAKRNGDEHLSTAIKILMNSFYGVMGSPGCRFYHSDLPSAITRTGQWLLLESRAFLESLGYEVLYGDTDSLFVRIVSEDATTSPDQVAEIGSRLAKKLNGYWTERISDDFDLHSYLEMEYEKHYRKFLLPPARAGGAAKKRYAGLLVGGAGDAQTEELHFVGMETVRSDWTEAAKVFQRGLYERIFRDGEAPVEWIKEFVTRLRDGEFNEQLVYRKRLRKPVHEYVKSIPQHVRAARMLDRPGTSVSYLMTLRQGPVPVQLRPLDIDYEYYLEHQLKPIADTVLGFFDTNFDEIVHSTQLNLF